MKNRVKYEEKVAKILLWFAALTIICILFAIVSFIVIKGVSSLSWEFFTENPKRGGKEGGIYSTVISTLYLTGVALALSTPIGVGAAIYLTEYVKQGRVVRLIRFGTESLAGIPSIIFGLFGFVFFVIFLKMGWSVLSGGLTLTMMILPTIVRTAEEALKSVPRSYREGSLALGATKWMTIYRVVLPSAIPGILTGIILSIGRAVGETAAIMLTAGSALGIPLSLYDPARTMSVHLYVLAMEGLSMENAFATATVLIALVTIVNMLANRFRIYFTKQVS